jgi:hypothetical protein
MITDTSFPEDGWDPLLKAAVVATDFAVAASAKGIPHAVVAKTIDAWEVMRVELAKHLYLSPESIQAELAHLLDLRLSERGPGFQGAIYAQAGDFTAYYADLLACSPATRPATWSLVLIGLQIGGMVAARFKGEFMRARPVQVWPGVAPMIDTPAHPAYPSGHALQAYLIERCVRQAAPAMGRALRGLSEEIAVNRERAGVHWPSDKEGSWAIVPTIMAVLETVESYKRVRERAAAEWTLSSRMDGKALTAPGGTVLTAVPVSKAAVPITPSASGAAPEPVNDTGDIIQLDEKPATTSTSTVATISAKPVDQSVSRGRIKTKAGAAPISQRSWRRANPKKEETK